MAANRGSQHGEESVLDALLPSGKGIYLDIGAWHPFQFNNTVFLYDRGWRGLLVEPQPDMALLLARHRPGDWVLPLAVSSTEGTAKLRVAGAYSTLEEDWPIRAEKEIIVETQTASQIIDWFPQLQSTCDFCSIDVEGHERAVLEGWNWSTCRPRVMLIEAVKYRPRGRGKPTWQDWEYLLFENGYDWVTQIGVNRVYLSQRNDVYQLRAAPNGATVSKERQMLSRLPRDVVDRAQRLLPTATFIETGTYQGDSADWASGRFDRVVTIEIERGLWLSCQHRFSSNVTNLLGDSSHCLREVLRSNPCQSCILWLDAHWSARTTGRGLTECPLLAELDALVNHGAPWIAIIDDARFFRTPPPPPHDADQWPTVRDIAGVLGRCGTLGARDDFLVACSDRAIAESLFTDAGISTLPDQH